MTLRERVYGFAIRVALIASAAVTLVWAGVVLAAVALGVAIMWPS